MGNKEKLIPYRRVRQSRSGQQSGPGAERLHRGRKALWAGAAEGDGPWSQEGSSGHASTHQSLAELLKEIEKKLCLPQAQRIGLWMVGKSGVNISVILMRKLSFIEIKIFVSSLVLSS